MRLVLPIALVALVLGPRARAGHPSLTDDAGTTAAGAYEFEITATHVTADASNTTELGLAARRGLIRFLDAGAAVTLTRANDTSVAFALDAKLRLNVGGSFVPAGFVRGDTSIDDARTGASPSWDGFGIGATWTFDRRAVTLESTGVAADRSYDPVGARLVWFESLAAGWTVVLESSTQPFADDAAPHDALVGVIHQFRGLGAVSLGVRHRDDGNGGDQAVVTLGLTR